MQSHFLYKLSAVCTIDIILQTGPQSREVWSRDDNYYDCQYDGGIVCEFLGLLFFERERETKIHFQVVYLLLSNYLVYR